MQIYAVIETELADKTRKYEILRDISYWFRTGVKNLVATCYEENMAYKITEFLNSGGGVGIEPESH